MAGSSLKHSASGNGTAMAGVISGNASPVSTRRVTRSSSAKKQQGNHEQKDDTDTKALMPRKSRNSTDLGKVDPDTDKALFGDSISTPQMTKIKINPVRLLLVLAFELLGAQLTGVCTVSYCVS